MADKEIIIDGVDVSECKKYEHEMIRCNTSLKNMCLYGGRCTDKRNADCYYKQFKRKEKECEELKDKLNCCFCNPVMRLDDIEYLKKCVETTECFRRQLDQIQAEKLDLIDKVMVYKSIVDETTPQRYLKLKQTLQEIKEIAKFQLKDDCKDFRILNCNIDIIKQILQKCEVLKDVK